MLKSTHTVIILASSELAISDAVRPYDELASNPRFVWVLASDPVITTQVGYPVDTPWFSADVAPTHRYYASLASRYGPAKTAPDALVYINNELAISPEILRKAGA